MAEVIEGLPLTEAEIKAIRNHPSYQSNLEWWKGEGRRSHPAHSIIFCDESPFPDKGDSDIPVTFEMGGRLGLMAIDWYEGRHPVGEKPVRWYYFSELAAKIEIMAEALYEGSHEHVSQSKSSILPVIESQWERAFRGDGLIVEGRKQGESLKNYRVALRVNRSSDMSQYGTEVVRMVKIKTEVKGQAPSEVLLSNEDGNLVIENAPLSGHNFHIKIDRDAIFTLLTLDGIYPSSEYWKFCKASREEIDASIPISLIFNDCQGQKYEKTAE